MENSEARTRLSDLAQEEILRRIHSGELAVGTRLPTEPELAQQMGISRGILREALNALQARGYITRTPRGGSHIVHPESSLLCENVANHLINASFAELIDLREALESYTAVRALERITETDIERLRELNRFDKEHIIVGCRDFHEYIAELAGNRAILAFNDFYFERAQELANPADLALRRRDFDRDHERIIQALEKKSAHSVETALKRYFNKIRKHYHIETVIQKHTEEPL